MGITTSMILIAAGAIMRFAVTAQAKGFSVHTVGVILMIVGVVGLLISLLYLAPRRRAVVTERPVVRDREYY